MRTHKPVIFLTLGFLIGISVLLYPAFSNYWNSKTQSRAIVDYESVLEYLEPEDYSAVFQSAYDYNDALREVDFPLRDFEQVPGYYETLKIEGTNIIGYVKIDKISVELPIYHGTSEETLNIGVGHLEGSSLPVGGESTHSVMSAHRGLPNTDVEDFIRSAVVDGKFHANFFYLYITDDTGAFNLQRLIIARNLLEIPKREIHFPQSIVIVIGSLKYRGVILRFQILHNRFVTHDGT